MKTERMTTNNEPVYQEALRMFRVVHGEGDSGSERAFLAMNPAVQEGWLRLAREKVKPRAKKAAAATPVKVLKWCGKCRSDVPEHFEWCPACRSPLTEKKQAP